MRFNQNLFIGCVFLAFCLTLGIWAVIDIINHRFGQVAIGVTLSLICGAFAVRRFRLIRRPRSSALITR